ncbi:hypothetical protein ISN45_Aa08g002090 [Arabidopsis thaliana x Arabidopsis arenosa]|uniref:Uncharacterized protein n=1 Tax=Arabidopsis thaliana x Arabidopsis arenosa TaxID=1240361 RepID=A0A8T1XL68_9BRAS|nr:hypothetical protein ISN45_Aa08g002090 [Arabidopsis thaliana x Arabidopsis arenosa]KAG7532531.1 hypothetical protein ISN45_Aa08g002090 [Arabidopsis thaliana x Arabidopsis arenosa]
MEQEKLNQLSQHEGVPDDQLTRAETAEKLLRSEAETKKGRSSNMQSYEEKYRKTQTYHSEISEEIKDLKRQFEDVVFWCTVMEQLHPNLVPPSRRKPTQQHQQPR